ncbi:MAG: hypothetical protein Q9174_001633 [Haloplaca sp. 1 TL-2023]
MSVEVSLNTPLAEALSSVVQPKLTEIGWNTGGLDDSALGEYIILMLVNGKTQDQIAAELSNDLLSLGPEDTGATDFAAWLFEQVHRLNSQLSGGAGSQSQETHQGQTSASSTNGNHQSQSAHRSTDKSEAADMDMIEAMDDVQDGQIPTGPKSMRNPSRTGGKRLMGQLSKAMDRSGDSVLHRVRPQQGTERINMHHRQPPRGPRHDQNRNQRGPSSSRVVGNGAVPSVGTPAAMMNASPQQQMALFAMLEEQARMMSQILSPQQQALMSGMPQPAINPNFRPGFQPQNHQPDRSLFERVDRPLTQRPNNQVYKRHQHTNPGTAYRNQHSTEDVERIPDMLNGDMTSSMEVEGSQKSQSEASPENICKFNLRCTKKDCHFAHQSPAAPPGITLDLSSTCSFGARCQNRKCVMRHPSPAQNSALAATEDCKYFPNCTNHSCPYRHPASAQLCRFGDNCTREDCKFKHVTVACKFNPCLNASCPYKHLEGQQQARQGGNVWTADGNQEKEHVSERKFVDEDANEELVVPANQRHASETSNLVTEVVM